MQVGRWCAIDTAFARLSPDDRDAEMEILMSAINAELVDINPGPAPHSIKLTAAGLEAYRVAPEPGNRRKR
jgi:hypothetical protein